MSDPARNLASFNRQVLQLQDEAFTLACDLVGDEARAAGIAQGAFASLYHGGWDGKSSIRLAIFTRIIREGECMRGTIKNGEAAPQRTRDAGATLLAGLPACERAAILLVDRLGLTYAEAAQVLGCPPGRLIGRLASARRKGIDPSVRTVQARV